ncbi:RNA degradosome polyphosphate kinase [Spirochaetia bacterium]|nr:RNA degradosome polyphosphate kinase [Spirochaetia bacterium]
MSEGTRMRMVEGRFINRDLSWIDFNRRVLEEGLRPELPPLERLRYLAIVSSNFDEFFMVRVAAIKRSIRAAANKLPAIKDPSGMSPEKQLREAALRVREIIALQYRCMEEEVFPALAKGGLELARPESYMLSQMDYLESLFIREIYPVLTPLRIEAEGPLPSVKSASLYAAFLLLPDTADIHPADTTEHISIIQIPPALDRIIKLPGVDGKITWALLEDVVITWGSYIFPGYTVKENMLFKLNRDADFSVDEQRDEDFIEAMEEVLENREHSPAVRMAYSPGSEKLKTALASRFNLEEIDLYEWSGPFNSADLLELVNIPGFDQLREKPWKIYGNPSFPESESIWDRLGQGDALVHLPYESFDPVLRFFEEAAADPAVIAIKTALYRTSGNSPVVKSLEQAALNGKQVVVVVELKARFDEERNISWANRLEKAGVIVVYGLARLKVHAKISMVLRRENDRIKRYVHLSTGNYNDKTAKLYSDLSFFTTREEIAYDAGLFFNMITGYSAIQPMRLLVIAPTALKQRLLELIGRETDRSSQEYPGRIMAKMNSLADPDIIEAIYRASQAGVKIFLNVRGICMLVPGVPELSENIKVVSIIDHYLEHGRIFSFVNGGAEEIFLSSADWMPRNLERRVELMFPVLQEEIKNQVREILLAYFKDNSQSWELNSDGRWRRPETAAEEKFRVQTSFLERAERASAPLISAPEFIVRRSPS